MLVGFVLKGEDRSRIVDVDTTDHKEALDVVKEAYNARKFERVLVCIEGGKAIAEAA